MLVQTTSVQAAYANTNTNTNTSNNTDTTNNSNNTIDITQGPWAAYVDCSCPKYRRSSVSLSDAPKIHRVGEQSFQQPTVEFYVFENSEHLTNKRPSSDYPRLLSEGAVGQLPRRADV